MYYTIFKEFMKQEHDMNRPSYEFEINEFTQRIVNWNL